jgi:hypothetical protein
MLFFPYKKYQLVSSLDPNEVKAKLRAQVEPREKFRYSKMGTNGVPFEGELQIKTFTIQRIIYFKKPYHPRISGRIEPTENGSRIYITTKVSMATYLILFMWIGFMALFGIPLLVDRFYQSGLFISLLFILSIAAMMWRFNKEYAISRSIFKKIWEAD